MQLYECRGIHLWAKIYRQVYNFYASVCITCERAWVSFQYKDVPDIRLRIYTDAHCKDKMVVRPSYLYIGNSWTGNTWWRHQMETFDASLAFCAGNWPVTGEIPARRPVTQSFGVSLICAWKSGWVNNRDAGDLRRHRAHYNVIVMMVLSYWNSPLISRYITIPRECQKSRSVIFLTVFPHWHVWSRIYAKQIHDGGLKVVLSLLCSRIHGQILRELCSGKWGHVDLITGCAWCVSGTSGTTSDYKIIDMIAFPFQCRCSAKL